MRYITEMTDLGIKINDMPERRRESYPELKDELFWKLYGVASKYSLLHVTGFYNLFQSLKYIHDNKLPGDIVECGCFLGGASIFMALMRDQLGLSAKRVWLFDTFEGFPEGEEDALVGNGQIMNSVRFVNFQQDVRDNFKEACPDARNVEMVQGAVEVTIPSTSIGAISLLRLDTDFYLSTLAEFDGLYARLVRGGVIIVDDYGMFEGSRRATDEYLGRLQSPPLLNRIDHGVWAGVKP